MAKAIIEKGVLGAVTAAFFVAPAIAAGEDLPFPYCRALATYTDARQLASAFEPFIFQIETYGLDGLPEDGKYQENLDDECWPYDRDAKSPCWRQSGNATLVDPAGVFITVSHNLHYRKRPRDKAKDRRWHSELLNTKNPPPLVRVRRGDGAVFAVEERAFGSPYVNCDQWQRAHGEIADDCARVLDFSVLVLRDEERGEFERDRSADRPPPDLYLGETFADQNSSRLTLYAYLDAALDKEPAAFDHQIDWSSINRMIESDGSETQHFITRGGSVDGTSGAPAIDEKGRIRGLLRGPCKSNIFCGGGDDVRSYLTRVAAARYFLTHAPLARESRAERFVAGLASGEVPSDLAADAARGNLTALETLRVLTPLLRDWRDHKANPSATPFAYRAALRQYEPSMALLNAATCNFMTAESYALVEAIIDANKPRGEEGPGQISFGGNGPERAGRNAILTIANRMVDATLSIARNAPEDAIGAGPKEALLALYDDLLRVDLGATEEAARALPRYGLLLASQPGADAGRIADIAERSLAAAPRDWRSALLAAHALDLGGYAAESREMALVALALNEEDERERLQASDLAGAAAARSVREHLQRSLDPLKAMSAPDIGRASSGLVRRFDEGKLAGPERVSDVAAGSRAER